MDPALLYDLSSPTCVIRIIMELLIMVLTSFYLFIECHQLASMGLWGYLGGSQGSWNGVEFSSAALLLVTIPLQVGRARVRGPGSRVLI